MVAVASAAECAEFVSRHPQWRCDGPTGALRRDLQFDDFATAIAFIQRGAALADALDHHPDWRNVYNRVWLVLTTHDCGGVSARDFVLGAQLDQLAVELHAAQPPAR